MKKKVDYKKLPYFETQVVKVRKEACNHENLKCYYSQQDGYITYQCCKCKALIKIKNEQHPKGNWVNGENLDKIKFPCFCSYKYRQDMEGIQGYGIITKTCTIQQDLYTLHGIDYQKSGISSMSSYGELKPLIKRYDIHILKGKVIIFEEEKTNE